MNKYFLLATILLSIFSRLVFAKHVDEHKAQSVAQNFLAHKVDLPQFKGATNLVLAYKAELISNPSTNHEQLASKICFYVFNINTSGFIIVSGDDHVSPILAYSNEGLFVFEEMPNNVKKWIENYKIQIRDVIENDIKATKEIQSEWHFLTNGDKNIATKSVSSVLPLVQARWHQTPYYNAQCPGGSVTGCVATAMAQIMKYWNFPNTGSGFHSYNHSNYGTISANFGNTTYNWGAMPNSLNSSNNAIATLMFHCGVSVNMNYSPSVSGAYIISAMSPYQNCSEYALKTYFGYKSTMQGIQRSSYSSAQWINLLRTELDASRPILYAGFGSGGGHAFVCDGYDNNNFFHFNWGWGGAYDGYFSINALNPNGVGTGGGSGGYNSGHQALIGIEPPAGSQTFNMGLYDFVTPSTTTIGYGQSFSVSTNIVNNGTSTFSGDYCAAIFDNQSNFIDYVDILTGYSLQSGYIYNNNLVFSNSGLFSMLPGTYYIGIFYRPTGGNWIKVSDNGNYTNLTQITVVNNNAIRLNSVMTLSPGTTLTQGQTASVNVNILNAGSSTFTGQYIVGLYNLDGSYVQTIGTINENNGLAPNYTYLSPYLTFSNTITASPGTYLVAMQHKPTGSSSWQLTGSSNSFSNPVKVIVQSSSLSPDQYENNNTSNAAHTLALSFSNNTANKNTTGSNLHIGSDNDYYKIQLPTGFDYTITPRLHDSYNSGNGNVYSCDALFSYSLNGNTWSATYDHTMSTPITVTNGGTIYFHIAPFFAGETGTYLLDMAISRTQTTIGVETIEAGDIIQIYPNPARDFLMVDLKELTDKAYKITITNLQGQQISHLSLEDNKQHLRIPLKDSPSGVYLFQVHTPQRILTKKIIIQ